MYYDDRAEVPSQLITLLDILDIDSLTMSVMEQLGEFGMIDPNPTNYLEILNDNFDLCKEEEFYDAFKNDIEQRVINLYSFVEERLKAKYGVEIGLDFDTLGIEDYVKQIGTMYEFFYVRHYENVYRFFTSEILSRKKEYAELYKKDLDTKDSLVTVAKKRWEDQDYVTIFHFMDEIIKSIRNAEYDLTSVVEKVTEFEPEELTNHIIIEMLEDAGRGLIVVEELTSYNKYIRLLNNDTIYYRIKHEIKENIMKTIEPKKETKQ